MGWIIFILATLGWHIGLYGMFKKTGIKPWKALVPFYNTWCIVEKCNMFVGLQTSFISFKNETGENFKSQCFIFNSLIAF